MHLAYFFRHENTLFAPKTQIETKATVAKYAMVEGK
jgi:hypothetical protein